MAKLTLDFFFCDWKHKILYLLKRCHLIFKQEGLGRKILNYLHKFFFPFKAKVNNSSLIGLGYTQTLKPGKSMQKKLRINKCYFSLEISKRFFLWENVNHFVILLFHLLSQWWTFPGTALLILDVCWKQNLTIHWPVRCSYMLMQNIPTISCFTDK